jgi:pimeloyl-ACP methyl ester carboxylesterase
VIDHEGNYVRTYEVGFEREENEPPRQIMILLHGYGGCSIMFWKIVKPLAEKYHLIMVDTLGMGASSRPDFNIEDPEEAVEFLTSWFEVWRQKMGGLSGFILAGHSFGGFIAGHYSCKYPQYVKKLLMLSPFGVPKRTFTDEEFSELYATYQPQPGQRKPPQFMFSVTRRAWRNKWSPYGILRKSGRCLVNMFLSRWARNRIGGVLP